MVRRADWSVSVNSELPGASLNKRALDERGGVSDLVIRLLFLLLLRTPHLPLLAGAVKPEHQHQQGQEHQSHGESQQHPLQDSWGIVRSWRTTQHKTGRLRVDGIRMLV